MARTEITIPIKLTFQDAHIIGWCLLDAARNALDNQDKERGLMCAQLARKIGGKISGPVSGKSEIAVRADTLLERLERLEKL